VCLAGCFAFAMVLDYKQGFRAGVISIFSAFAVAIFGLFLFPIHFPSGNVYFSLLGVTFGGALVTVAATAGNEVVLSNLEAWTDFATGKHASRKQCFKRCAVMLRNSESQSSRRAIRRS